MKFKKRYLSASVLLAMTPTCLSAQTLEAQEKQIERRQAVIVEEVIVTVDRRETTLQDYAGTAQAMTADELDSLGVGSEFQNLQFIIPGALISNQEGNVNIRIRGVGSPDNTEVIDASVTNLLNGVYLPRARGLGAMFYDIERVEVNKGPQGVNRGRNALGGSVNIVTKRPRHDEWGTGFKIERGSNNLDNFEGYVNMPASDTLAFRAATFTRQSDSFYKNANVRPELKPAGAVDEFAGRFSIDWVPNDFMSWFLSLDYVSEGGTGYPGLNYATALNGDTTRPAYDVDDLSEPQEGIWRGWQGRLDSTHQGLTSEIKWELGDFAELEYLASYREIDFYQENATNDGVNFPGRVESIRNDGGFDNYAQNFWLTKSESHVHELRLASIGSQAFEWAVGGFFYQEDMQQGFFSTSDNSFCCYSGTEFSIPDVEQNSTAVYFDGAYNFSDKLTFRFGVRATEDEKSRVGLGGNYAFRALALGQGFSITQFARVATEGYVYDPFGRNFDVESYRAMLDAATSGDPAQLNSLAAELERTGLWPDYDFSNINQLTPDQGRALAGLLFLDDGTTNWGLRDTVDDWLDNCFGLLGGTVGECNLNGTPSQLASQGMSIQDQSGKYDDSYVDYRLALEYAASENNLLYATLSTGHKSGGFNDTFRDADGNLLATTFEPEFLTSFELGSKNTFENWRVNASAFFYQYDDYVITQLVSIGEGKRDPVTNVLSDPPQSAARTNASEAEIYGLETEIVGLIGDNWTVGANTLFISGEFKEGLVSDSRQGFGRNPDVDIGGNTLPGMSDVNLNAYLRADFEVHGGSLDATLSASYKSKFFLNEFNSQGFDCLGNPVPLEDTPNNDLGDGGGCVDGNLTSPGKNGDAFSDEVPASLVVNFTTGYSHASTGIRVEAYVNNVTDEIFSQKAIISPGSNLRFMNTPRQAGVRLKYNL